MLWTCQYRVIVFPKWSVTSGQVLIWAVLVFAHLFYSIPQRLEYYTRQVLEFLSFGIACHLAPSKGIFGVILTPWRPASHGYWITSQYIKEDLTATIWNLLNHLSGFYLKPFLPTWMLCKVCPLFTSVWHTFNSLAERTVAKADFGHKRTMGWSRVVLYYLCAHVKPKFVKEFSQTPFLVFTFSYQAHLVDPLHKHIEYCHLQFPWISQILHLHSEQIAVGCLVNWLNWCEFTVNSSWDHG